MALLVFHQRGICVVKEPANHGDGLGQAYWEGGGNQGAGAPSTRRSEPAFGSLFFAGLSSNRHFYRTVFWGRPVTEGD